MSLDFYVRSDVNATKLAAAIAHSVYAERPVNLRAVGAGAVNQAIKAVAIANNFVADRDIELFVVPEFITVPTAEGKDISALTLGVLVAPVSED